MIEPAFPQNLGDALRNHAVSYRLYHLLWHSIDELGEVSNWDRWVKLKYLNDNGNYHPSLNLVPNKSGGLYIFYIKCPTLLNITEFPFYIGRAHLGETQNLRKRIKEYLKEYKRGFCSESRFRIVDMFEKWKDYLYIAFIPLDGNDRINRLEAILLDNLIPPFNSKVANVLINRSIPAFQ